MKIQTNTKQADNKESSLGKLLILTSSIIALAAICTFFVLKDSEIEKAGPHAIESIDIDTLHIASNSDSLSTRPVEKKTRYIHPGTVFFDEIGRRCLIVQDEDYNLSAIAKGKAVWQFGLDKPVLSDILNVRCKAGRVLAFNTSDEVYCIKVSGNEVANFPIDLEFDISGEIKKRRDKILVPAHHKILLIEAHSGNIEEIKMDKDLIKGTIQEIVPFQYKGENKIAYRTARNEIGIVNHQGKQEIKPVKLSDKIGILKLDVDPLPLYERIVAFGDDGKAHIINFKSQTFGLSLTTNPDSNAKALLVDLHSDERKDYLIATDRTITIKGYNKKDFITFTSFEVPSKIKQIVTRKIKGEQTIEVTTDNHITYWYNAFGDKTVDAPIPLDAITGTWKWRGDSIHIAGLHQSTLESINVKAQ